MLTKEEAKKDYQLVDKLYQRWMIGNENQLTKEMLPQSWHEVIKPIEQEKLNLAALALASQHRMMLTTPKPPKDLKPHSSLPILAQTILPNALRPLFRRIINNTERRDSFSIAKLLYLLLEHEFVCHPADWLPAGYNTDLPPNYLLWCQWSSDQEVVSHEILTEENWNEWYPAERLEQLKVLRLSNANKARELIETCCSQESAEKRVNIIQTLAINLSTDDSEYLKTLRQDRSKKVATIASQYLSRLGLLHTLEHQVPEDNEARYDESPVYELAETYTVKKTGLINREISISPKKLKSKKQQSIRTEQLSKISLIQFSHALECELDDLIKYWNFKDNRESDNLAFLSNSINTLNDNQIICLLDNMLGNIDEQEKHSFTQISERLNYQQKQDLALNLLQKNQLNISFSEALNITNRPIVGLEQPILENTKAWKSLNKQIKDDLAENGFISYYIIQDELCALGLLLTNNCAESLLEKIIQLGVMRSDPALDYLKFNAELSAN